MLPKDIRQKKQEAKKSLLHMKRIMRRMENYLSSSDIKAIEIAAAFFKVLEHHVNDGDLNPADLHLVALLRRQQDD